MTEWIAKVGIGLVSGVSIALAGFAKNKGEELDIVKFGTTVAIGAVVGLLNGLTGLPVNMGIDYLANAGVTTLIENLFKAGKRRLLDKE